MLWQVKLLGWWYSCDSGIVQASLFHVHRKIYAMECISRTSLNNNSIGFGLCIDMIIKTLLRITVQSNVQTNETIFCFMAGVTSGTGECQRVVEWRQLNWYVEKVENIMVNVKVNSYKCLISVVNNRLLFGLA